MQATSVTAPRFVHLRLHSEFSLIDSLISIKKLFKLASSEQVAACAITDVQNEFAAIKFYKAALASGIKPIMGAECWVVHPEEDVLSRIVLLAQNHAGYLALSRLLSRGYLEGQESGFPTLQFDWLRPEADHLIALSGAQASLIGRALLDGNQAKAIEVLQRWKELFPKRFYLELQRIGKPREEEYIRAACHLAQTTQTPVVATNAVCFLKASDFEAHEARVCINSGWQLGDSKRPREYTNQQYFRSSTEMEQLFADIPSALENSVEIAKRCSVELTLGKPQLPDFPIPAGFTEAEYFRHISHEGLVKRMETLQLTPEQQETYKKRLDIELDVIIQMGFPGYFLIVADFIGWAKEHGIPVGPGRGSGAGSLVAYAQGITDLDPLPYDLLFERFLNPERVSMPDFDIDFCMERRDEVIQYVADKYGRDSVSQIATHGTMAAKGVIRDVGRVLGHPYGFVDRIAKLIPFALDMTLEKALEDEELKKVYDEDEEVKTLFDLALQLEGLTRSIGRHAGGVVIAPTKLTDFSPIYCEKDSRALVTQFDKDDVESAGLVKFDFLGLRTLTIIDWAVKTINRMQNQEDALLDISQIPLDDPRTFALLKRCETTAVFQLESRGMKDLIRRLQPDSFEDIVALVALFRPGPLESGMVDDFVNRKHGRAQTVYAFPELEPILSPTYGVIVYQEQVMQISQAIGGYTLGGADLLRRAMGKKKPEEMAQQREIFMTGAEQQQFDSNKAGALFDLMEKFAGYGFNKSHSAGYALLSYQTAWLKAHYPAAFMAAVLSSDMDKTDKVLIFMDECRSMKLPVLPPSINLSDYMFTVNDRNEIIYGLGAIKGVGRAAISVILEQRQKDGRFTDLLEFCSRVDLSKANKRTLETLIRAGALDELVTDQLDMPSRQLARATLMMHLPDALKIAEQRGRNKATGQLDLFGEPTMQEVIATLPNLPPIVPWMEDFLLSSEKESLGLYLTAHPVTRFRKDLSHIVTHTLAELAEMPAPTDAGDKKGYRRRDQGRSATIAGQIVAMRTKINQRGQKMVFVTLDDATSQTELRIFSETYETYRDLIKEDNILILKGNCSWDDFSNQMRLNPSEILDLPTAREKVARALLVKLKQAQLDEVAFLRLETVLKQHRKEQGLRVVICYQNDKAMAKLICADAWRIQPNEVLLHELQQVAEIEVEYS